ncbi:alcohol dehydrogenase-3 [Coleophoma cylindrospora]|uniref:Alcohol dehydrogenase-3 n=1 Tax=Coleophoma cylindrospora TaxID=1849047 RepID=A0A3D8QA03_9HELO|nr:alcohol dehydrogenase-3 [Coleophoma cylindrospora]
MAVSVSRTWTLNSGMEGLDKLKFNDTTISSVGHHEVLVRFHYASLNYRDVQMTTGKNISNVKDNVVPGSDGAGIVIAIGSAVTRFKAGDKVLTVFANVFGSPTLDDFLNLPLGGAQDGTFRQYGVFNEERLVTMPASLTFQEASCLTCAGVTAWNALYGLPCYSIKPGDVVLTQGTGGVSTFAIHFAKIAGATVIATTSSEERVEFLKNMALPPDHIINYKTDPNWGDTAKSLSPDGQGVDHVIEIGGPGTLEQSFKAIKLGGLISVIGYRGGISGEAPAFVEIIRRNCILRGVLVGNRQHLEEMIHAIDANRIKPILDPKEWKLEELKEAYEYMLESKHLGKVTIRID